MVPKKSELIREYLTFRPKHDLKKLYRARFERTPPAHLSLESRFAKQVTQEAETARLLQEKLDAEKKAEAAKLSKKKKGKK